MAERGANTEERNQVDDVPTRSWPFSFIVVAVALGLASIVFVVVIRTFRVPFGEDPTLVITALSTLFGIFGTVIGAYFGVKLSSDTVDKTQGTINRTIDTANQALAELDPERAREVAEGRTRRRRGQPPP